MVLSFNCISDSWYKSNYFRCLMCIVGWQLFFPRGSQNPKEAGTFISPGFCCYHVCVKTVHCKFNTTKFMVMSI